MPEVEKKVPTELEREMRAVDFQARVKEANVSINQILERLKLGMKAVIRVAPDNTAIVAMNTYVDGKNYDENKIDAAGEVNPVVEPAEVSKKTNAKKRTKK